MITHVRARNLGGEKQDAGVIGTYAGDMHVCWWLRSTCSSWNRRLYSNYSVGLAYEKLSINALRRLGFQLMHTGGKGDKGLDFIGYWVLPDREVPIIGETSMTPSSL